MKPRIKIYAAAAAMLLLSGCGLLEIDMVSDITAADYWKSKGDVESYLYGTYDSFRTTVNNTALGHCEDRGDSFVKGLTGGPSTSWSQTISASQGIGWDRFYGTIQHCNNIIKNAQTVPFGLESEKKALIAEAYFMRAYMYFSLMKSYGKVPLELVPTESSTKPKLARAPEEEVMERILTDIKTAITDFGEDGFPAGKARASRPACYALKADALLWKYKVLGSGDQQDLRDAIEAADMASAGLELDDFANVYGTKKGREVIFAIHFDILEVAGHYSNQLKPKESHLGSAVNKNDLAWAKTAAGTTYMVSPAVVNIFSHPNDVRKGLSIIEAREPGKSIGWFDNKMRGTEASGDRAYDNDIIVYRLAEMILFKAEAYAALGETGPAIAALELVRDRAGTGTYTGAQSKDAVEKEILDERFRELYLERKRWNDLVRFHYGGTINVYDVVPNLNDKPGMPLFLPIPPKDMALNSNLEQTEGWEDAN